MTLLRYQGMIALTISLALMSCMEGTSRVTSPENISKQREFDARAFASFAEMQRIETLNCGPFLVEFRANANIDTAQLNDVPNLGATGGFWPGMVRILRLKEDATEPSGLMTSRPIEADDVRVFEVSSEGFHPLEGPEIISVPPENILEYGAAPLFDRRVYDPVPWRKFVSRNDGTGNFLIRFNRPERLKWDSGSCEVSWPDLRVSIQN